MSAGKDCGPVDLMEWEYKENAEISLWHCNRPGYWEGDNVYCSKCQIKMEDHDQVKTN